VASKRKILVFEPFEPLDPLYYNADGEMIGHEVAPLDRMQEGVFWCRICGGHPEDPIHQPGWKPYRAEEQLNG
jgi:hypothetical protein